MAHLQGVQPVLMSRNIGASIRFYVDRLGFTLLFQDAPVDPKYVGVKRDGVELHLQWHDAGEWDHPNDRPTYRFAVEDVDGLFEEFCARGIDDQSTKPGDTAWGTYEFHVRDPDRNGLQFYRRRGKATAPATPDH